MGGKCGFIEHYELFVMWTFFLSLRWNENLYLLWIIMSWAGMYCFVQPNTFLDEKWRKEKFLERFSSLIPVNPLLFLHFVTFFVIFRTNSRNTQMKGINRAIKIWRINECRTLNFFPLFFFWLNCDQMWVFLIMTKSMFVTTIKVLIPFEKAQKRREIIKSSGYKCNKTKNYKRAIYVILEYFKCRKR